MARLKIAAAQMNIVFERSDINCETLKSAAREAAENDVDVLILPETFSLGFTMNSALAIKDEATTLRVLRDTARRHEIYLIAGMHRCLSDGRPANVAVVVNRAGQLVHQYVKTHGFSLMDEPLHFACGDGTDVFAVEGVSMALGICYDIRFPELFRPLASRAHVLVIIASWPSSRQMHWDTLLRARAIENQAYVIGVNRVGEMGEIVYDGGSAVILPQGEVGGRLASEAGLLVHDVDTEVVQKVRASLPFLKDIKLIEQAQRPEKPDKMQ
jgi:omega-amidase